MHEREDVFVKRRIYLTLERGRDIVLRNLLRKVYLLGGFDELKEGETVPVRRTRIPELEFRTAISVSSDVPLGRGRPGLMMDQDEVECMMANMIYKVSYLFVVSPARRRLPWCRAHRLPAFTVEQKNQQKTEILLLVSRWQSFD